MSWRVGELRSAFAASTFALSRYGGQAAASVGSLPAVHLRTARYSGQPACTPKLAQISGERKSAKGGSRTPKAFRLPDPKSGASASSATFARPSSYRAGRSYRAERPRAPWGIADGRLWQMGNWRFWKIQVAICHLNSRGYVPLRPPPDGERGREEDGGAGV